MLQVRGWDTSHAKGEDLLKKETQCSVLTPRFFLFMSGLVFVFYGGTFLYLAWHQVLYPGFAEPMEGDVLQHIERIASGLPPYPLPTGEFIALAHMPLYYYVSAPLYLLLGDSFLGPRLVSSLAATASGLLVGWIAWKESRLLWVALLASGLYFAGFKLMDGYLTVALPDSLFLLCLLLGFAFFAYGTTRLHDILWLVCFSLAFWTKQHGAVFFALMALHALFFRKNRVSRWVLIAGGLTLGPLLYLALGPFLGDGFFYHTFIVPGRWHRHLWFSGRRLAFLLACYVPFLTLLALIYLRGTLRWRPLRIPPLPWFLLVAISSAAITMIASGAANNHYIPFMAASSAAAALGARELTSRGEPSRILTWLYVMLGFTGLVTLVSLRLYPDRPISLVPACSGAAVLLLYVLLRRTSLPLPARSLGLAILLTAGHLVVCAYSISDYLPDPSFRTAQIGLRRELSRLDGPVIWINYGKVPPSLIGLETLPAPSWVALEDIERQNAGMAEIARALAGFQREIRSREPLYLLSDAPLGDIPVWRHLSGDFVLHKDFGPEFSGIRLIATRWYGWRSFPRFLYRSAPARHA